MIRVLAAHPEVSYREVGDLVGLSKQRVGKIVQRAGFSRKSTKCPHRDDITVDKVLELYDRNVLVKDIALVLGCDRSTVRQRLRAAGVDKAQCLSRSMRLYWRGHHSGTTNHHSGTTNHHSDKRKRYTLSISEQTKDSLDSIKHIGQSYDGLLRELIKLWQKEYGRKNQVEMLAGEN